MSIQVKLTGKVEVAEGTMAFHFEKPEGFEFKGGQSVDLTLIDPPETDGEGNTRAFSLVSAPSENEIVVATRMRDTAFKRVLNNLPIGTEVKLDGPFGSFALHNNVSKAAVFLIGGIGITPVRSMIVQAAHDKLAHQLVVIYSNHKPEDAAFLEELQNLQKENPNYTFVPTMTKMEDSKKEWNGETGRVNKDLLTKYIGDLHSPICYLCGPAGMVSAMRKLLNDVGVDDDDIRTEEFPGY